MVGGGAGDCQSWAVASVRLLRMRPALGRPWAFPSWKFSFAFVTPESPSLCTLSRRGPHYYLS